jgi:DNA polymerase
MNTADKQKMASFLDLAEDYLSTGYHGEPKNYNFDDAPPAQTSEDSIEKIADEIRACYDCGLGKTRIKAAPGEGVLNPLVLVIGEGPGEDEDKQGRPFVGKAGQLLDKMLAAIN